MSDLNFLSLFVFLIFAFYCCINFLLADLFKNKKSYMAAASFLLALVFVISVGTLGRSPLACVPSNVQDDFYKGGTEGKGGKPLEEKHKHEEVKLNIDSKEIKDIIKQLEVPEERQKLIKTLEILSAGVEGMNKDKK